MPNQHKRTPMSLRLPEALSAWVAKRAEQTGKTRHRVVVEAVEAARGHPAPVAASTPQPGAEQAAKHGEDERA